MLTQQFSWIRTDKTIIGANGKIPNLHIQRELSLSSSCRNHVWDIKYCTVWDKLQAQLLSTTTTPWLLVSVGRVERYGAWEFVRVGERVCLLCQCIGCNCAKRLKQTSCYQISLLHKFLCFYIKFRWRVIFTGFLDWHSFKIVYIRQWTSFWKLIILINLKVFLEKIKPNFSKKSKKITLNHECHESPLLRKLSSKILGLDFWRLLQVGKTVYFRQLSNQVCGQVLPHMCHQLYSLSKQHRTPFLQTPLFNITQLIRKKSYWVKYRSKIIDK